MRPEELEAKRATEWVSLTKRCAITFDQQSYTMGALFRRKTVYADEMLYTANSSELPKIPLDTLLAVNSQSVVYIFGTEGAIRLDQTDGLVRVSAIGIDGRKLVSDGHLASTEGIVKFGDLRPLVVPYEEYVSLSMPGLEDAHLMPEPVKAHGEINVGTVVGIMTQGHVMDAPQERIPRRNPDLLPGVTAIIERYRQQTGFVRPAGI